MHTTPFDTPSVASAAVRPPAAGATTIAAAALAASLAPAVAAPAIAAAAPAATLAATAVPTAIAGATSVSSPAPAVACEFHLVLGNHDLWIRA
jgi:hypothetical protein